MWNAGRTVHASSAQMPGLRFADALRELRAGIEEDYGTASLAHCQLCPQNFGELDDETLAVLVSENPATRFRLHANVRPCGYRSRSFDASTQDAAAMRYFRDVADISEKLGATAYTLHAGERVNAPLESVFDFTRRLEDLFGHAVGVEGLYPDIGRKWLIDSWDEYRALLESGCRYALDLSHLHILSVRSRRREDGLVRELLASPACIEVHLSHNSGTRDEHIPMRGFAAPWWVELLLSAHPDAVFFTEGNEKRGPEATARVLRRLNSHLPPLLEST